MQTKQRTTLSRSVVHLISKYLEPKQIFRLTTEKEWEYSLTNQEEYTCRDRAMMALTFCSAGRITEVVGGPQFRWDKTRGKITARGPKGMGIKTGKRHLGLRIENLQVSEKYILVSEMEVVKRSQKMIDKYGSQITQRDQFAIPLVTELYKNRFWDQLVPFGWLILEYLQKYAPEQGKLFPFEDTRAFQIIDKVTGMFPHWFRAQAEHFYGHYLLTDTVKLAKFVNIQDPKHVKHYIGYSWSEQLKDAEVSMNFEWIDPTIHAIGERLKC